MTLPVPRLRLAGCEKYSTLLKKLKHLSSQPLQKNEVQNTAFWERTKTLLQNLLYNAHLIRKKAITRISN